MARLTEEMVIARSKQSDLTAIKKLNCWGAELGDVSLLRRMPNVEVLALSINKIRTLVDFAGCRRLRELYVRKNEIGDLSEIRHLRRLPDLTSLWLDENPCTQVPEYRMTVLRNLPNLEKLDNVAVQPDEVQEAMRRGVHIPDSDDEGYPQQQESYGQYRRQRSCESSPERDTDSFYTRPPPSTRQDQTGSDSSEAGAEPQPEAARADAQCPLSPTRRAPPAAASPDSDERYEHPAMTRSHYDPASAARSPDAPTLRHSLSAHSVKEYSYSSNGECRFGSGGRVSSPPQYNESYYERADRSESYGQMSTRCSGEAWEERGGGSWGAASAWPRTSERARCTSASERGSTRLPSWLTTGASPGDLLPETQTCYRRCCASSRSWTTRASRSPRWPSGVAWTSWRTASDVTPRRPSPPRRRTDVIPASDVTPALTSRASDVSPALTSRASDVTPALTSRASDVTPALTSRASDVSPALTSPASDVNPAVTTPCPRHGNSSSQSRATTSATTPRHVHKRTPLLRPVVYRFGTGLSPGRYI